MEEKKRRTKKIVAAEEMKATREERVLRKFEDVKNKWNRQRQKIKERTKKRETLADQGEKYRERNELNTLIEHLNKEEKKKVNWTENLRAEGENIKFKDAVKKVNLEGGFCKGNKDIFERVFQDGAIQNEAPTGTASQRENSTAEKQNDPYVTNRDAKKELYQGQIINKLRSNLEFVLKNFAIPLDDSGFLVQGRRVDIEAVEPADEEALPTVRNIEETTLPYHPINDPKVDPPANEQPVQTSRQVIRIQNQGGKVIRNSIDLHNTSSSIVLFTISYKKKLSLQNEVLRQKDYLFFDEQKNYTLVISPNVGYLKPGEKKSISLTFFFHYLVNTFGALTIRYLCGQEVFQRHVSVQVDSFLEGDASSGDCSFYGNLAYANSRQGEGGPLKNRLNNFFSYTKGRVFSSASHFANQDRELTLEMVPSLKDTHVKVAPPSIEFTSEGNSPNGGEKADGHSTRSPLSGGASISRGSSTDHSMRRNLSESFREAVKQYIIVLVKSYVNVHGEDHEQKRTPMCAQNKASTPPHEKEPYSSHISKRGKESSRGVKRGESLPNIDEQHIAFAKDTFLNHLLGSLPYASRKRYFATLLHMALEQVVLTKSPSFYLHRYFDIIQFVLMTMLRGKPSDDLPPEEEETVFVQTNAPLLRYIVGFVHNLYKSNQPNHQVNHMKEAFFYFLSSAFLCIRRGVRNVILFVDDSIGGSIPLGGEAHQEGKAEVEGEGDGDDDSGGDFLSGVFHSFVFSYVRAFLSAQGKTHYALHFVRREEDVSQVCEAVLAQGGTVKGDATNGMRGMPTDDAPNDVVGVSIHDAPGSATCKVEEDAGETPPEEDFFKNFQADEDYTNFFFGESGGNEPPQGGGDKKGNIVFVADREVFARGVYEWHYGWLVGRVQSRLAIAQVGQGGDPSAAFPTTRDATTDAPTTDVLTSDAPPTDEPPTLIRKKTATGKMKNSVEFTAKKQKRRNDKGGKYTLRQGSIPNRGKPAAEAAMSQNDDHTDEPTEGKQHTCTSYHLQKLFEVFGATTYIIDEPPEADGKKCMQVPQGVKVHVGMVATKMVNLFPFLFNFISVDQVDKLHREGKHGGYFLYDYFVLRNRDRLFEAMRRVVHYLDAESDISGKDHLFGKIPLPCDYDVGPFEEGEKHSTTMQEENPVIGEKNRLHPRATPPKYLWIISPNTKNDVLDYSNLDDIVEWLKLLNMAICMKVSDLYVCGQLFFLFLFFMFDSGSLSARWCEGGEKQRGRRINQAYLRIDADNPTGGCRSAAVAAGEENRSCSFVQLDFLDVEDFPEPLLLLLKVNLFNILQLCDKNQIKLHFPEDIFLHPSEPILRSSTDTSPLLSVYCHFPHRNYNQMIRATRRKFLRKYGHRLANLGSFTSEALKGGDLPQGSSNWVEKPREGEKEKGEGEEDNKHEEKQDDDVVAIRVDPPPTERTASSPQRVQVCSQDVGRRTLNSIISGLRGADKILWLCGALERDTQQDYCSSLELLECIVAAQRERHKLRTEDEPKKPYEKNCTDQREGGAPQFSHADRRGVVHLNNLIVLNEDVYFLYHCWPRKDVNIPFLFRTHKVLVHLFDRTFPPSGFSFPF
ncbi:hypothetical protein C922_05022 [Plasmodium inui San Antonio 1]|uniref:Uncharacterized protein n=1 Tax=Plasmodium inui San Antonio 1 TaxID=1237626 RepID=W6ZV16_9APIC|nr:hypothetical protein C922_05022 [Plasmodium inui San Antonio 1]EUD64607.1 hypothetical protein C922_05022 [Plasmodium inui San Antonio 1]